MPPQHHYASLTRSNSKFCSIHVSYPAHLRALTHVARTCIQLDVTRQSAAIPAVTHGPCAQRFERHRGRPRPARIQDTNCGTVPNPGFGLPTHLSPTHSYYFFCIHVVIAVLYSDPLLLHLFPPPPLSPFPFPPHRPRIGGRSAMTICQERRRPRCRYIMRPSQLTRPVEPSRHCCTLQILPSDI